MTLRVELIVEPTGPLAGSVHPARCRAKLAGDFTPALAERVRRAVLLGAGRVIELGPLTDRVFRALQGEADVVCV